MDWPLSVISSELFAIAAGVALLAGVIKGMVGFAMPMIFVSGLGLFLDPQLALAGLILPTLASNGVQALRQGRQAAWESLRRFRVFLIFGGVALLISSQLVRVLPDRAMLLLIGVPVTLFALSQLLGMPLSARALTSRIGAAAIALLAGFVGGVSGVWGPPTVAYLTALGTEKRDQMRIQGVIYGLGSAALAVAHVGSGVLRPETAAFSAALLLPALMGMWAGTLLQDRIAQATFRRVTLVVLAVAGVNLVRRGLMG